MTVDITNAPFATPQGQVARKYQEEIFRQAQKGNVIAYLRTGSGKTLISVLLIRWMSTQEKARGKIIVFFVPKVSLVEQQARYIEKETGLRVDRLHGALALKFSDRQGWKKKFENHDVVVITAQLFLELITHSLWSIDKVSLMVYDECHHARKNHPYNGIMREYAQLQDKSRRPKIFGMTASPYWNEKNPALSLWTLETNLQSKIVGVHEHVEELQANFNRLDEVIHQYPYPPTTYEDYPKPTLFEALKTFEVNDPVLFEQLDIPWSKVEMRYYMTLNNLGPYCASLYLFAEMQHHMSAALIKAKDVLAANSQNDAMELDVAPSKCPPIGMFDILDIQDDFAPFFESAESDSALPIPVPMTWCSPKIRALVDIIQTHRKENFQCIIFVEQRQVASCLAKVLEVIPDLQGFVKCAHLVGQGVNSEGVSNQMHAFKGDPIKLFREKTANVLIATSVAEEGLDFPACDLVIRFDPLQHLVGYVQSRGRARSEASKYIIMIQQDNIAQLERYRALQQGESELSRTYHTQRNAGENGTVKDDESDDPYETIDPFDVAERDRIVIPSTGAVLTYDNAMGLLNHLCALIPRDAFTPQHKPIYTGEYQARLRLPSGLPLAPKHLCYIGYPKRSKKEAKRSVAFLAVKHLLRLNVFNEYLLPTSQEGEGVDDDEDDVRKMRAKNNSGKLPPDAMEVRVKDPWCLGEKLWLHTVLVDGREAAGLVTGTALPPATVFHKGREIRSGGCSPLSLDEEGIDHSQRIMDAFTKWGIRARNTGRPIEEKCSLFFVPLKDGKIDFDSMQDLVTNRPSRDWTNIREDMADDIFVLNLNEPGRTYRLKRIRSDLTMPSEPSKDSPASSFPTYHAYFVDKWTRKKREAIVPIDGPLIEATNLPKCRDGGHSLDGEAPSPRKVETAPLLLPQGSCSWVPFSHDLSIAFEALPVLCRRLTDAYRVRGARWDLRLPHISENLMIEALTLPTALRPFNNQRLETLGDAALELGTTIHLLNEYPNRHEGQLSNLRQQFISNRYLLNRAREFGLEHYISCEVTSNHAWRYTIPAGEEDQISPERYVIVTYPRRSLQDCMEALLGASFLQGGILMALRTGTSLGLNLGGPLPWSLRYKRSGAEVPVTSLFTTLQEKLGYDFHSNDLVVEAVTHPSFAYSDSSSYQRLEFLGDAFLNLVVVRYLYEKYPTATPHQLTYLRAKVVCSPTLAYLAITKLDLHKIILANSMDLCRAIDQYVPILETLSPDEIVKRSWKYDPPKAISDVFESVVGAVLVDTGYEYEKAAAVVEILMEDVLDVLFPSMATNPVSEFLEWTAKQGCEKSNKQNKKLPMDAVSTGEGVVVTVHSTVIVGPVLASSPNVARFIAAERALTILSDPSNPLSLAKLCDCHTSMQVDVVMPDQVSTATAPTVHVADDGSAEMDARGQVDVPVEVEVVEQGAAQVDMEQDDD
ncbi:hypothetical protein H1R20_g14630, partial [Candolleomyces eurysporus]